MAYLVKKYNIAYFPVPKVACTSLKKMFYFLENGAHFKDYTDDNGKYRHIHEGALKSVSFYRDPRPDEIAAHPDVSDAIRIAVLRDPLERLVSAYTNRVLFYKELSEELLAGTAAEALGLKPDPNFVQFVENLDAYRLVSETIKHHTDPMTYFLGSDLAYYQKIYDIKELGKLEADLKEITGFDYNIPHEQKSKISFVPPELSKKIWKIVREFYSGDYALLNTI